MGAVIVVLMALSLICWVFLYATAEVSSGFKKCVGCRGTIKPGDRIEYSKRGPKHYSCL